MLSMYIVFGDNATRDEIEAESYEDAAKRMMISRGICTADRLSVYHSRSLVNYAYAECVLQDDELIYSDRFKYQTSTANQRHISAYWD